MVKYYLPLYYSVDERISLIRKHIEEGLDFDQIGELFNVQGATIKYHWNRYFLRTTHQKPKQKPKQRPKQRPRDVYREYLVELSKAGLI